MLSMLLAILLVSITARLGWDLGGKLVYVYHLLIGFLPLSIQKHLWLE